MLDMTTQKKGKIAGGSYVQYSNWHKSKKQMLPPRGQVSN